MNTEWISILFFDNQITQIRFPKNWQKRRFEQSVFLNEFRKTSYKFLILIPQRQENMQPDLTSFFQKCLKIQKFALIQSYCFCSTISNCDLMLITIKFDTDCSLIQEKKTTKNYRKKLQKNDLKIEF